MLTLNYGAAPTLSMRFFPMKWISLPILLLILLAATIFPWRQAIAGDFDNLARAGTLTDQNEQGNHFLHPSPQAISSGYASPFFPFQIAAPDNPYVDDLVVDHDDTLEGDVVVASGDVLIEEGGEILGNLIVASGDIEIEAGGRIDGDVTSLSGDVDVAGKILGNLSLLSGDVEIEDSGVVEGDVSVFSGDVDQEDGAQIGGELRLGPDIGLSFFDPPAPDVPDAPNVPPAPAPNRIEHRTSFFERFLGFIFRLIGAGLGLFAVSAGAGILARSKPAYIESVRQRLLKGMAANFATGFLFNMVLGLLAIITFCLLPMSLIASGLMIAVNGIGWTAIAATVGRRLTGYTDVPIPSTATVVLGALAITAPVALVWSLDVGCLRFMGLLAAFVVSSAGAGSVLSPWIERLSSDDEDGGGGDHGDDGLVPQLSG